MRNLIFILGDQLTTKISSLHDFDKDNDQILMAELRAEATYAPHHKKKLVLILSAMRHFALNLENQGFKVHYIKFDNAENSHSFTSELQKFITNFRPKKVILTEPSEYRVLKMFDDFKASSSTEIEIRNDDRFIATHHEFANFAKNKKSLLLENFYHLMRKKTGLLMEKTGKSQDLKPVGGKWNYDKENRQTMPKEVSPPKILHSKHSKIVEEVIELVEKNFSKNFGDTKNFFFATTENQAREQFDDFLKNRLKDFGTYQDAMREDVDFGFHSVISMYINLGLLDALECCKAVEKLYYEGKCDLNCAEGFIRQIIGWREYIRGIYWHFMPAYKDLNYFSHNKKLPDFYWDENKTQMNCLKQAIRQTRKNAYSHHIQRLMITGNFALLSEISPAEINEWYLAVYADAFEWVELPNTHGMAIYADGGIVASKPYCSSGNYINKMSNFCKNCVYEVKKTIDEEDSKTSYKKACPFNFLYWNFLIKNEKKLRSNPRLFYPYANLGRKTKNEIEKIKNSAAKFIESIYK